MSNETQQLETSTAADPQSDDASLDAAPSSRWDVIRDAFAVLLLVVALVVPWNLSFGVGVSSSEVWLFAVVFAATALSLCSLGLSRVAPPSAAAAVDKARLWLNVPYLLVALGFVGFTIVEFVRFGGDGDVPPGVGPGLLVGVAGALLAAQPAYSGTHEDGDPFVGWFAFVGGVSKVATVLAVLAVLFNFWWRTRRVYPEVFQGSTFVASAAVLETAVAYGAVALIAVRIGLRWLQDDKQPARLATIALGTSSLLGSVLVWSLGGVGRDVDAFHGIAQNTSTAGVGYEGYLAWAIGAAVFAPTILRQAFTTKPIAATVWHEALRKCLLLIAFWCLASALLRVLDVIVALSSGLPSRPYDNLVLLAFDAVAGALAYWLRGGIGGTSSPAVVSRLAGVLFVLLICRVVVGVGLAREILYAAPPAGLDDAVYGNTLTHQITSTFDVVLCLLGLAVLATAVFVLQFGGRLRPERAASPEPEAEVVEVPVVEPVAEPEPVVEPVAAPEPVIVPEPVVKPEPEPEPIVVVAPEPEPEPEPAPEPPAAPAPDVGRHRHRRRSVPPSTFG